MKLNIAICDDNQVDLRAESKAVQEILTLKSISYKINEYDNSKDFIQSDEKYDIVFLDVKMNGTDGLGVAKNIHTVNRRCLIFFVTNHEAYMDSAMDEHAFRFWTKPINKDRLMYGIESAIRKIKSYNVCITVNIDRQKVNIPINKIMYIFSENKKTRIVTIDKEFVTNEPLKTIKSQIASDSFCESHASFYVNLNYVKDYTHTTVTCAYKEKEYTVHMSRRKYNELNKHFIDWMGEQI